MNVSKFSVYSSKELVALPAISICIYFSKPAREIAKHIAEAIDNYIQFVGHDKLKQYSANSGYWRNLTKRKFNKDMSILRDYPEDLLGIIMEYNSDDEGLPGPFGIYMFIRDEVLDTFPLSTNFLRFDFNSGFVDSSNVDEFVEWYVKLLEHLPFQSSNAGYSYKRVEHSKDKASDGVDKKISRYYGFDPGYESLRDEMRGRLTSAHWLNAIDKELMQKLGGFTQISSLLKDSELINMNNGLVIRGAGLPPLGDINKLAPDIGSIPEIARLFKPLRTPISAFGGSIDAQTWLARYDEMDNRPWKKQIT